MQRRRALHAAAGPLVFCALSLVAAGCSTEPEALVVSPHAIALADGSSVGGTRLLVSGVPLSCADAQYLERGAPPGARFKAVLHLGSWKVGALQPSAHAALFDDEGLLSVSARGPVEEPEPGVVIERSWGTFELLDAPRAKGAVARLRTSAQGTFTVTDRRPALEEYDAYRLTFGGEPEHRPFSFSGDVDVALCSDIVDAK